MKTKILVTGASGYVGSRLIPELQQAGYFIRAFVRDRRKVSYREWKDVEVAEGDVAHYETLLPALQEIDVAYYLIHSMTSAGAGFEEKDIEYARNFSKACAAQGVKRIIYLGGLGGSGGSKLSAHLKSRQDTGDALRSTKVPVTELRAAIVVGSGSASFEIIRDLCKKLPLMITPRWVQSRCEPIAIRSLLAYLVGVLKEPRSTGEVLEVGGGEILTYAQMMEQCAEVMGKRIFMIPVPVLTPRLSSYWLNLVTSVPMNLAKPLVEGLRNDVVCTDHRIRDWITVPKLSYREAVSRALKLETDGELVSRWTDATTKQASAAIPTSDEFFLDERSVVVNVAPARVFEEIQQMGGKHGWFHANWLWRLRAIMDWLIGGVGMRRGRPTRKNLRVGDPVDFWRVENIIPDENITLRAEMRLPGIARLSISTAALENGAKTLLVSRAVFWPTGILGKVYWYAVLPLHNYVFQGMLAAIKQRAEEPVSVAA